MSAHRMDTPAPGVTNWLHLALGLLLFPAVLVGVYSQNTSLSHDLAEMFSVIVAFGIFMLTWNARNLIDNHYFVFLGIAYLFVGGLDYLHAVSFVGDFTPRHRSVSIEFWFASRYLQAFSLLAAPLFADRRVRAGIVFPAFSAIALVLFGMVYLGWFPDFYLPGSGLTPAKRVHDYIVSGIQGLSVATLWSVRDRFDRDVFRLLVASVVLLVATELSAFVYADAFVYNSIVGHSFQVASFFLLYKAVIQTGLVRPYALLFRNLQISASEVRNARDLLEVQVAARTEELRTANRRLEEDLAERQRAAAMRELMLDFHQLSQSADNARDLLSALSTFLQARFGFEAVGIRYQQDADYPYIAPRGFPSEFVREETSLCTPGPATGGGDAAERGPSLECACGAVIRKRFEPNLPFFTPNGTFWTNDASGLFASSEAFRALANRSLCVREGYESIVLVPLRFGEETFGLVQLNDRRKGLCTPHLLERVERVAESVSGALARLATQEALRESEDRFRSLVENSSIAILICQRERVLYGNPRLEQMFGELRAGKPFRELGAVHPEDAWKFERLCDDMERPVPGHLDMDIRFVAAGGGNAPEPVRWIRCQATPVTFRGRASHLVEMTDITRVRELEHIVTVRDKLASLGQMAAGIAHEIRNPLSGININVSTLDLVCRRAEGLEPEERERIRHAVAQAQSASERISRVIRRVMDFAKPSPPKRTRIDMNRIVRDTLALSAVSARKGGIDVREIPSTEPLYCDADPSLMEQVLLNLVMNAFQAMESSDRPGRLTVTVAAEGGRAVLRVADTGPGVPGHLRDKIFEPFYTTRRDGYGIGLSFSHRIVSDHGGRLSVGEADGGGAEFRVELPLAGERSRP